MTRRGGLPTCVTGLETLPELSAPPRLGASTYDASDAVKAWHEGGYSLPASWLAVQCGANSKQRLNLVCLLLKCREGWGSEL